MISKENVPGPGAYTAEFETKKAPAYTLRSKCDAIKKDVQFPGPGHVDVSFNWETSKPNQGGWLPLNKNQKLNERGREMVANSNVPGPGAYQNASTTSNISFTI